MLRVNYAALVLVDDKYYFKKSLFTGIALRFESGYLKEILEYSNGKIMGLFLNKTIPHDNLVEVHMEEMLFGGDYYEVPYYINGDECTGNEFTGYAYSFEDEYCVAEYKIINKFVECEANFSKKGQLEYINIYKYDGMFENERSQIAKYDSNDKLLELNLSSRRGKCELFVTFDKNHCLNQVRISGDYFKYFNKLFSPDITPVLSKKDLIEKFNSVSTKLKISGEGFDQELFIENNLFKNVNHLIIGEDFHIDNSVYKLIYSISNLKTLRFEVKNLDIQELNKLKKSIPNCQIFYFDQLI